MWAGEGIAELLNWVRGNWKASLFFVPLIIIVGLVVYASIVVISIVAPRITEDYMGSRHSDFRAALNTYAEMNVQLNKLLIRYNADRAGLYRFHNDKADNLRISYYFCNVDTMVGRAVDLPSITDLNASVYAPIYSTVLKGRAWASDVKNVEEGALKDLLIKRGDAFIVYVPIFDLENDLAGLLSVSWLNSDRVPNSEERASMITDLYSEGRTLGGYYLSRAPRREKP